MCSRKPPSSKVPRKRTTAQVQHAWDEQPWSFARLRPQPSFPPNPWSGLPCPPSEDLPNPGIEPRSPAWWADCRRGTCFSDMHLDGANPASISLHCLAGGARLGPVCPRRDVAVFPSATIAAYTGGGWSQSSATSASYLISASDHTRGRAGVSLVTQFKCFTGQEQFLLWEVWLSGLLDFYLWPLPGTCQGHTCYCSSLCKISLKHSLVICLSLHNNFHILPPPRYSVGDGILWYKGCRVMLSPINYLIHWSIHSTLFGA